MNRSMKPADLRPARAGSVPQPANAAFIAGLNAARRRLIAVLAMTCAVMMGALSFAGSAGAATNANVSCPATGYAQINGKCLPIKHTTTLSPAASAALQEAMSTPAGQAALRKAFQSLKGARIGVVHTSTAYASPDVFMHPDWNCPGGASCGISWSGGLHFWVIVSYAVVFDVGAPRFFTACSGALSPIIDPAAAVAACGAVTAIIWALVNNAPWTTNHGIWLAVYWNHISRGFW